MALGFQTNRLVGCWRRASFLRGAVVAAAIVCAGCGDDGAARYDMTGAVTFDGKPVPKGYVRFAPDKDAGASGPGASATILDGVYKTLPARDRPVDRMSSKSSETTACRIRLMATRYRSVGRSSRSMKFASTCRKNLGNMTLTFLRGRMSGQARPHI